MQQYHDDYTTHRRFTEDCTLYEQMDEYEISAKAEDRFYDYMSFMTSKHY